jgi:hypothetical protein
LLFEIISRVNGIMLALGLLLLLGVPAMGTSQTGDNVEATVVLQLRDFLAYNTLARRQIAVLAIPTTYAGLNSGPQPGSVVGIVLGSVAGFLLLLWFLYTCFGAGNPFAGVSGAVVEEEVIRRRSTSSHRRSRSRHETVILEEL